MIKNHSRLNLTRRDLGWIILFLVISISELIGLVILNPNKVNSFLSFTGTVTSIILSVIAIIYTLIESLRSSSVQEKLEGTSENITGLVDTLDSSVSSLEKVTSAMQEVAAMKQELQGVKSLIQDGNYEVKNLIDKMQFSVDNNQEQIEAKSINTEHELRNVNDTQMLELIKYEKNSMLLTIWYYAYENKKTVQEVIIDYVDEYMEIAEDGSSYNGQVLQIGMMYGEIVNMESLGIITMNPNMKDIIDNKEWVMEMKKTNVFKNTHRNLVLTYKKLS